MYRNLQNNLGDIKKLKLSERKNFSSKQIDAIFNLSNSMTVILDMINKDLRERKRLNKKLGY
jgi:hypothetical protein